jgi:outer membrane lipoprotein carrier protein
MLSTLAVTFALLCAPAGATEPPGSAQAPAQAATVAVDKAELLSRIAARYGDVKGLTARFHQVSTSALYGGAEQDGTLTLQRPKKMRWDFEGDGKQFITDGQTMWIYSPADKQVIRYRDFGGSPSDPTNALLQSLDKLEEHFEVTVLGGDANGYELALVPRDEAAKAQVKQVTLSLDGELLLRGVKVLDAYDGVTTLTFESVQLGADVPDARFTFEIPEGVDVVDAQG